MREGRNSDKAGTDKGTAIKIKREKKRASKKKEAGKREMESKTKNQEKRQNYEMKGKNQKDTQNTNAGSWPVRNGTACHAPAKFPGVDDQGKAELGLARSNA